MNNMYNVLFKHVQISALKCICVEFVLVTDSPRKKQNFVIICSGIDF